MTPLDLSVSPPRSPYDELDGLVFMPRTIDKLRSMLPGGNPGEYFINGVQARLKDIHELFMDTGVGAKGYSVIEQGHVGQIVNSQPEERRLVVQED